MFYSVDDLQSTEEPESNEQSLSLINEVWSSQNPSRYDTTEQNFFHSSNSQKSFNFDSSNLPNPMQSKRRKFIPPVIDTNLEEENDIVNHCETNYQQKQIFNNNPFDNQSIGVQKNLCYSNPLYHQSLSTKSMSFISYNSISNGILPSLSHSGGTKSFNFSGNLTQSNQFSIYKNKNCNLTPVNKINPQSSLFPFLSLSISNEQRNSFIHQINNITNKSMYQSFNPNKNIKFPKQYEYSIQQETNYIINIEDLIMKKDFKTTVRLKYIPQKHSVNDLMKDINNKLGLNGENNQFTYDFVYLPTSPEKADKNLNLKYAFFNFIDPIFVVDFYYKIKGIKWSKTHTNKECVLTFAKIQGKDASINRLIAPQEQEKSLCIFDTPSDIMNFLFHNNYKIQIPKNYIPLIQKYQKEYYQFFEFF